MPHSAHMHDDHQSRGCYAGGWHTTAITPASAMGIQLLFLLPVQKAFLHIPLQMDRLRSAEVFVEFPLNLYLYRFNIWAQAQLKLMRGTCDACELRQMLDTLPA